MTDQFTFRLPDELRAALQAKADNLGITLGELIRRALAEHVLRS